MSSRKKLRGCGCASSGWTSVAYPSKIVFLITGKNKTDVVYDIMKSGDTGPAAYVAHHAESVDIFTDVEITG